MGGGVTGPRPQPSRPAAAVAQTKHIAPRRRIVYRVMGMLAAARSLVEAPQAKISWPTALVASLAGPWLLSLAFPFANLGLFAFIALVPLFFLWSKASWKEAFFWGWLAGT